MAKQYRVMWDKRIRTTDIPGKYAGSRNTKIFGRLDCPSGKRKIRRENRIFFHDWEDAIEMGHRPCKICKPDEIRLGEELSVFHPAMDKIHVAIWETSPHPYPEKPQICFYVALNKEEQNKKFAVSVQANPEKHPPYPIAIRKALEWGRRLGLPVINHFWKAKNKVLYLPGEVTESQLRERARVFKEKEVMRFGYPAVFGK